MSDRVTVVAPSSENGGGLLPTDVAMWRVDGPEPVEVLPSAPALERDLEDAIEARPEILGEPLLMIGRQVPTGTGGIVDLVAVDSDGVLRVIELKRDRAPREVVAQVLDYATWAETLHHDDIEALYARYALEPFEAAFEARFGTAPPADVGVAHRLTIVATLVDDMTERILTYLARFGVPVDTVLFRYFESGGARYLTTAGAGESPRSGPVQRRPRARAAAWNGVDWYAAFGDGPVRAWEDARRYGFVSAGGGAWYSGKLRGPEIGHRINAYIPKAGYVGVGHVTGPAVPVEHAMVEVGGRRIKLLDLPLTGTYRHSGEEHDPDLREWLLPVAWHRTVPIEEAFRPSGVFALQHPACRLTCSHTVDLLAERFGSDHG